jgi:hypothetical protein
VNERHLIAVEKQLLLSEAAAVRDHLLLPC